MRSRSAFTFVTFIAALVLPRADALAGLPIQHWQTSGGARVYFVESHDLPIIDVSVDFPAGSSTDSRRKSGLAAMTQRLLTLGAGGLSENEISARLADVGAQLGGRFDPDRAGLTLRTLSSAQAREVAFDVFTRVLQRPEFPQDVLEREKARVVAALKEADTKPDTLAERALARLLYRDHPYALREAGEVETVSALTRDDLQAHYQAHYRRGAAVVAMIGDLTRPEAEALAERLTQGLPAGNAGLELPPVPLPDGQVERIDHPATQSHILLGYPGVTRDDPDYFPLYVGNYILGGGGFVSRLNQEIREKRGLAYSVYSYFLPLKVQGPFRVGLQTKKGQGGEALEVVRKTLERFIAQGPTAEELKQAKQHIVGGFPLRIDSNKKILEFLAVIGFYELPLTYLDDFLKKVDAVTLPQIRDAFKRRIDPQRMVTVVVGTAER